MGRLIKIIDTELSKQPVSTYKAAPKFLPSQLGTPCLRKIYYGYLRVDKDFPADTQLTKYGKLGSAVGEILAETFRSAGVLVDYHNPDGTLAKSFFKEGENNLEFPVKAPDLEISAFLDAILIIDGKLWIGEFKTATVKSFADLQRPKDDHLVQGSMYLYLFNAALKEGKFSHIKRLDGFEKAEGVIFLYANKDDLSMKEFTLTEASAVFIKTVEKIIAIKNHINNQTLPPKTADWCKSCPWRAKCAADYKVEP